MRRALDVDLAKVRRAPAKPLQGRGALVLLAQLKADEYDTEPTPERMRDLLALVDRIGIGEVQLLDRPSQGDEWGDFEADMGRPEP